MEINDKETFFSITKTDAALCLFGEILSSVNCG